MEMCTFYFIIPCSHILAPTKETIQKIKLELSSLLCHGGKYELEMGTSMNCSIKLSLGHFT